MGHDKFKTVRGVHRETCIQRGGGYLVFLFLFYFQTNVFSALGTNGTWLRVSERLTVHTLQFKANAEKRYRGNDVQILRPERVW